MKCSDWVHDKYEDDRDGMLYGSDPFFDWLVSNKFLAHPSRAPRRRGDRYSPSPNRYVLYSILGWNNC